MERFINKEELPESLWCKEKGVIKLPELLVETWKSLLDQNGLSELATKEADEGFIGGASKEDTNKHLAWRYNGSCGRVILSLLDPKHTLSKVSDAYAEIFAGQKVFLADLPSGSGAAVVSILTTLADLRKNNVLPRIPLQISIVAGEISPSARGYMSQQLNDLRSDLKKQAIDIDFEILHWDVLDSINTADLIRRITLKSENSDARLLTVSNFSGFLESSSNWKKAQQQFSNVFIHSRDKHSAAIWIEPRTNKVVKGFYPKVIKWFRKLFQPILRRPKIDDKPIEDFYGVADIHCEQPIKEGTFPVRLTVARFDLPVE